jgi:GNAT superfamily N-acetyltransferase
MLADKTVRLLTKRDVEAAIDLSTAAGWNQTAADWEMLLSLAPEGCFAIGSGGALRATATLLDYGRRLGWIGMVLTHPLYRRRGFARALLEHVIRDADAHGIACLKLDATDQGQPLYESFGFRAEQSVTRWWRRGDPSACAPRDDGQIPPSLRMMDEEAFGADRWAILQALAERSVVIASASGFALLRPGLKASYAGPCAARNAEAASDLIKACVHAAGSSDCCWDIPGRNQPAMQLAHELGFQPRRKLVRMERGVPCNGRVEWVYGIAGFELG